MADDKKKKKTAGGGAVDKIPAKRKKKADTAVPAGEPVLKKQDGDIEELIGDIADIKKSVSIDEGDSAGLLSHLDEFRSRFIFSLISVTAVTIAALFFFSDYLLKVINQPFSATGLKLNIFRLMDGFLLRVKASFIAALLICFPVLVYEIWKLIAPRINWKDRGFLRTTVICAVFLFYSGVGLTYLSLPLAVKALIGFTPEEMANTIDASQYLSFLFLFCTSMGLVFELPIVILILTKIGLITPDFLAKKRKFAIVIIWIIAAVITPTVDPLTQTFVAVPLMLLYEISIIISKIVVKRKKAAEFY